MSNRLTTHSRGIVARRRTGAAMLAAAPPGLGLAASEHCRHGRRRYRHALQRQRSDRHRPAERRNAADERADQAADQPSPTSPSRSPCCPKELLQEQGVVSLADALKNVPGITIGGAEGGQIGNNINLNGFTARTDIFLDGFRDRGPVLPRPPSPWTRSRC
ncbi:MAG: TonB-dependent receptor plug domain-containing protein [Caulobacteraceae bacterium]